MTVTVSGIVKDVTGKRDASEWRVFSPVYREGSDGAVVGVREQPVRVTGGVFSAAIEPGIAEIVSPTGDKWTVTVPDEDANLWDLIEVAAGVPPTTGADLLAAAVETFVENNPGYPWSGIGGKPAVIAAGASQAAAQIALGGGAGGRPVFEAGTTGAARAALGVTELGDALFTAATQLAGRGALGGGEAGGVVFAADTMAAARGSMVVPSDYDDSLSDTRAPINGSVSAAKLDAALTAFYGLVSAAVTSPYFQAASNGNVLNSYNNTNNNQKVAKFGSPHYSNSEEPVYGMRVESNSGSTLVQWGGGSSTGNAVTKHEWYSASDVGTTTGTKVAELDLSNGLKLTGVPLKAAASTTGYASVQLPHGVAPTSPVDGDLWSTTVGLFARINGVTRSAALLDGNGNLTADAFMVNGTSTVTAAGTTTLTVADTAVQVFTGSTTQTVKLPTTSIMAGQQYIVCNQSSGFVTVQSSDGSSLVVLRANKVGVFTALTDTPTTSTHWLADAPSPSAVASTVAMRDGNNNISAGGFVCNAQTTVTAAGTTTLTISSGQVQSFTGTNTQTVKLPTTSVSPGNEWVVINQSSGAVTVQSSAGNTIDTVTTGVGKKFMALIATPTAAADWKVS